TTPTQSLSLLNNSFVLRMGDQLEARVEATDNADAGQQVRSMYDFVFQRPPRPEESEAAVAFVNQHGLSALARVLFNTNEFLFAE
ncbi:MAG: DUF1553 domain-containing protein, partial [Planctomycetaceae bacterium]|nr:DUF1553 domain-containing protein [Planctomycetaceae bacterium]